MDITRSIEIMKSLADTSRLRIINSLMEKPQYVEEISHRLNLAASTVSFHLRKLDTAGLISQTKEQYYIIYRINEELFGLTLKDLTDFDDTEKESHNCRIERYKQKVLKAFFKKGQLIRVPVQRKKRMIVLAQFAGKFSSDKKYTEVEVNKLIMENYDDYCTIRRLLIEEGTLKRDKQYYWLNSEIKQGI